MIIKSQNELTSKEIISFESKNSLSRLILVNENFQISFMEIGPAGVLGMHKAHSDQIFIVVSGSGWVSDRDAFKSAINENDCVFWQKDEWHETGSDNGLKAVIIEGSELYPRFF